MNFFHKILVATDGSEASLKAARTAIGLATRAGAEVLVAHIVDDEVVKDLARALGKDEKDARSSMIDSARKYVAEIEKLAQQSSVDCRSVVEHGTPYEAILELAEREKVDVLVIGKTGRRGPRRALAGSVTRRVIDLAEISVLVVK